MPTAFLTGASGFVGANLTRALLGRGWTVRALVRGAAPALDGLPVERVAGDLFAPGLAEAMAGSDGVFHVAAFYSLWRCDAAAVMHVNVDGTRAVLAAARTARVPRFVHTSSVAAIGARPDGQPADERFQRPAHELIGAYKRSKYLAERIACAAAADGQDVVIVNPSTPVGPWDIKPTPTGEIVRRFLRGRMPAYIDTGLNLVDVRDVAAGHIAAFERGVAGRRYILGNENLTLRDLLERLAGLTGRPAPRTRIPRSLALAYAAASEFVLPRLGIAPDAPVDGVRMANDRMYYDAGRAHTELGVRPGPVTHALRDAVEWFRHHALAPGAAPSG